MLAGSRTPRDAQGVDPEGIQPLFHSLRDLYDYVLVDIGRTLSRISIPIVQQSGIVVFVIGPDLVTVELSKSALDFIGELGVENSRIFPILNRAVGLEGQTKLEIEEMIGLPIMGTVSHSKDNFTLATNQKLPYKQRYPVEGTTFELDTLAKKLNIQLEEVTSTK